MNSDFAFMTTHQNHGLQNTRRTRALFSSGSQVSRAKEKIMRSRTLCTLFCLVLLIALSACAPQPAPFPNGRLVDLTYSFSEETIYWPTAKPFTLEKVADGETPAGFYYAANNFSAAEHGGTHLDAPIHFSKGKFTNDQIPLEQLVGAAIVVDVSAAAATNRDYQVSVADFETWEDAHGRIPDKSIVLLRTGYGKFWPNREQYLGAAEVGAEAVAKLHFPGLHPEAAKWLVSNRNLGAIGIDTPSIDYGQATLFESHVTLFGANIPAFENVANLEELPATGAFVIALPMKIKGGSGGPLRMIAIVPHERE
jgi:kynurenine formamidase